MISIEIEIADDGSVTVGMQPPSEEAANTDKVDDKSYMQPAKSIDDALAMVKAMANQGGGQSQDAGMQSQANEQSFVDGFRGSMGNKSSGNY